MSDVSRPATNGELFADADLVGEKARVAVLPVGAVLLAGAAMSVETALLEALGEVIAGAPLRHMVTPGGHRMSVAMTNCGDLGWVSDHAGYRYATHDPVSGHSWPVMPAVFRTLAIDTASKAGYADFRPDACLINCYEPGARMSLHQDRNERDFNAPIVSVSLGLPVTFQFGGMRRTDPVRKLPLVHGDVLVWGGVSRLVFHGVLPLKDGSHPALGRVRMNLTFRVAR